MQTGINSAVYFPISIPALFKGKIYVGLEDNSLLMAPLIRCTGCAGSIYDSFGQENYHL